MTLGTIAIELAFAAISLGVIVLLARINRGEDILKIRRIEDENKEQDFRD